ncbi:MAG: HD family phosphohydrolase [Flavobacteriaceae bacterium]|nr:HD family phosphohydrolase [Flavobacteriaceae bacterium]|tara:strand:- start:108 stop:692 length:585 start_codon:yes stop_codon:yes gene_type:complete
MKLSFSTIQNQVLKTLEDKLPNYLKYHSVEHTKYVLEKAIYIASKEQVSGHDLFLLKIAALYHDIGFTKSNIEHEAIGCDIVRNELPKYGISGEDVDIICGMIMATKIPQHPQTHLEKILADADLEYLGTKHFKTVSELLYKELKHYNPNLTRSEWNSIQINFMQNHQYHTKFCRRYKAFRKQKHLEELKKQID